ncbi:DUF2975 domain-containing protein [Actinocorallia populi]|uniref:DUF2975 domain-containing protein n=1 Tax=Actinocorallia populi TaxID=2079200 RepID=UPI0013006A3A|nr:DUF2975 domain-containing protein [Actinocorallia populi]
MSRASRNPLQPFSFAVRFILALLVISTVSGVLYTAFNDRTSFLGVGDTAVCTTPELRFAGNEYDKGLTGYRKLVQPDTMLLVKNLQMCDDTPSMTQRVLYSMTQAPGFLLYFTVFFLFFRLLRTAETDSPFSPLVAVRLRVIGWTLIAGGYLAHAIQDGMDAALVDTFAVSDDILHNGIGIILLEGVLTLPLTDLLTGLGLLTIARVMQVGTRMREDLAGVV